MIAVIGKFAGPILAGVAGWFSGFFSSDSIKNLSWALMLIGLVAAIFAAWFFIKRG